MDKDKDEANEKEKTRGILKEITWPGPGKALKLTVCCVIASLAIGAVIYLYEFGISRIVELFIH